MPIISIRVSEQQKADLEQRANANIQTVSDFIISQLFPKKNMQNTSKASTLSHKEILKRVSHNLHSGELFTIPSLFTSAEWNNFDNTVSIGRTFRIAEKTNNSAVQTAVEFVDKKSGSPAVYRKK